MKTNKFHDYKNEKEYKERVREISKIQTYYISKSPNRVSEYWQKNGFGNGQKDKSDTTNKQ